MVVSHHRVILYFLFLLEADQNFEKCPTDLPRLIFVVNFNGIIEITSFISNSKIFLTDSTFERNSKIFRASCCISKFRKLVINFWDVSFYHFSNCPKN